MRDLSIYNVDVWTCGMETQYQEDLHGVESYEHYWPIIEPLYCEQLQIPPQTAWIISV